MPVCKHGSLGPPRACESDGDVVGRFGGNTRGRVDIDKAVGEEEVEYRWVPCAEVG